MEGEKSEILFRSIRGDCTVIFEKGNGCAIWVDGQPAAKVYEGLVAAILRDGPRSAASLISIIEERTGPIEGHDEVALAKMINHWRHLHFG
jgi:hypothetical protein